MKLLAIDTATDVCAVALTENGDSVGDLRLHQRKIHNEKLLYAINALLQGAGWQLKDLGGVALSNGPGSFTGLRIGISVAKGLSYAHGIPLVAVDTLDALAYRARHHDRIAVVMKVRQNELYLSRYVSNGSELKALSECRTIHIDDLPSQFDAGFLLIESPAGLVSSRLTTACRIAEADLCVVDPVSVAKLGSDKIADGNFADPVTLEPFYLKEFEPKRKKYYDAEQAA